MSLRDRLTERRDYWLSMKMYMHRVKKYMAGMLLAGVLLPSAAFAETSTSTIQSLLEQIRSLQAQIATLQAQKTTVLAEIVAHVGQGSQGDDVRRLQEWLSRDTSLYPGGQITGYYGNMTREAVKRFQRKHGIEATGWVGPKTLKKLNEVYGRAGKPWRSDDSHDGATVTLCHKDGSNQKTINVKQDAIAQHQAHGDTLGACASGGPDDAAPVLSTIRTSDISMTGATISWNIGELATSHVEYGTTTSYGLTGGVGASYGTSRSVSLRNLATSTTYHYRVVAKDKSGNTTSSGDLTFTTASPDTAAPTLSSVSATLLSSTTARIAWMTSEAATGRVYYATTSPATSTSPSVGTNALTTGHAFDIGGLSTSTTYHFLLESKDADGNTGTATGTFTTGN